MQVDHVFGARRKVWLARCQRIVAGTGACCTVLVQQAGQSQGSQASLATAQEMTPGDAAQPLCFTWR